jgi:hypothetical protein
MRLAVPPASRASSLPVTTEPDHNEVGQEPTRACGRMVHPQASGSNRQHERTLQAEAHGRPAGTVVEIGQGLEAGTCAKYVASASVNASARALWNTRREG